MTTSLVTMNKKKKSVKKKKTVKTKLFDALETDNYEKDFLMDFIRVGTDITMLDTSHMQYISDSAFNRRTVLEIDKHKIVFERDTPEIGYLRHFSYIFRPHTLTIKKQTSDRILLKVVQDGRVTNYKLENYV